MARRAPKQAGLPRDKVQREEFLEKVRLLEERLAQRNQDLTEEQIEEIAMRARHDILAGAIAREGIRFKKPRS